MHSADASDSRYESICYDAFLLVTPKASFHERPASHVIILQNKNLHPRLAVCLAELTPNRSDTWQEKNVKLQIHYINQ